MIGIKKWHHRAAMLAWLNFLLSQTMSTCNPAVEGSNNCRDLVLEVARICNLAVLLAGLIKEDDSVVVVKLLWYFPLLVIFCKTDSRIVALQSSWLSQTYLLKPQREVLPRLIIYCLSDEYQKALHVCTLHYQQRFKQKSFKGMRCKQCRLCWLSRVRRV